MMFRFVFGLPQLLHASIYQNSEMRKDYLRKEDYYMNIAILSAERSKDPVTQVGACIVNKDDRIVGIGYNGMPNNCPDKDMPWGKKGEPLDTKKFYVCHAEMNAIVNKYAADVRGCRMYVTLFPCNDCAKLIVQSGITKIIYLEDSKAEKDEFKASTKIFNWAKVELKEFKRGEMKHIPIYYSTNQKAEPQQEKEDHVTPHAQTG